MAEEKTKSEIHKGHRQRMRKQFLKDGIPNDLPEHQLLEFLLFYCIPRKDTNELAHDLLDAFGGSLVSVFDAPYEDLIKVKGISENNAALIKFIVPLAKRYLSESSNTVSFLKNTGQIIAYILPKFYSENSEVAYLLCLDGRGKVLDCPKLSEGDAVSSSVSLRKLAETAIKTGATAVVLAHNHPKGFPLPSENDINFTAQVGNFLRAMKIRLVDHIIVGNGEAVSLASSKDYSYLF